MGYFVCVIGGLLVTNVDAASANPRCNYRCRVWNDIMRESQYYDVHLSATGMHIAKL
jgi:hypothetical protein